jgi:iron complex transport system ATP-binding protein
LSTCFWGELLTSGPRGPWPGDIRIATNSLGTAGILHKGASPLPTLSGGETQHVLLSRSLAQDPSILLLDEPTNHLDLRNRRQMIDLLKRCRDEGKTIVLTTHDPDLASAIADHLILIGGDGSDYGEEEGAGLLLSMRAGSTICSRRRCSPGCTGSRSDTGNRGAS